MPASPHHRAVLMIGIAGLLWNLIGLLAVLGDLAGGDSAGLSEAQRAAAQAMPLWARAGSLAAVFGGIAGCVALIMRNGWAVALLALSLIGVILQDGWMLLFADVPGVVDKGAMVLQTIVILVSVALLAFARKARAAGLLG